MDIPEVEIGQTWAVISQDGTETKRGVVESIDGPSARLSGWLNMLVDEQSGKPGYIHSVDSPFGWKFVSDDRVPVAQVGQKWDFIFADGTKSNVSYEVIKIYGSVAKMHNCAEMTLLSDGRPALRESSPKGSWVLSSAPVQNTECKPSAGDFATIKRERDELQACLDEANENIERLEKALGHEMKQGMEVRNEMVNTIGSLRSEIASLLRAKASDDTTGGSMSSNETYNVYLVGGHGWTREAHVIEDGGSRLRISYADGGKYAERWAGRSECFATRELAHAASLEGQSDLSNIGIGPGDRVLVSGASEPSINGIYEVGVQVRNYLTLHELGHAWAKMVGPVKGPMAKTLRRETKRAGLRKSDRSMFQDGLREALLERGTVVNMGAVQPARSRIGDFVRAVVRVGVPISAGLALAKYLPL